MRSPSKFVIGLVVTTAIVTSVVYAFNYFSQHSAYNDILSNQPAIAAKKHLTPDEKINIKVYQESSPSVVNITTIALAYDFFYQAVPQKGSGSGVIVDPKGIIVTNNHVIEGARKLVVTLYDGTDYEAKILGTDVNNDLAVLEINVPENVKLPAIEFGDSEALEVGQKVYAIGNPFGLQSTLTSGLISSLSRTLKSENGRIIKNIIQTDAAINPGNSGGGLIDTSGHLVGINTAIFSPKAVGNVGIGFAIPIDTVEKIIDDLIQFGYVKRPYLGVTHMIALTPQLSQILRSPKSSGILVQAIVPTSPVEKANIKPGNKVVRIGRYNLVVGGDIIYSLDAKPVKSVGELISLIESKQPGDEVTITVIRNGQLKDVKVVLEERPRN